MKGLWTVLAVVVAGLLVWMLLSRGGNHDALPSPGARSDASRASDDQDAPFAGAIPPPAGVDVQESDGAPEPATRRLAGVVRGRAAGKMGPAIVFLLPKAGAGAPGAHVVSDDRGRFDLGDHDPRGHWIGAVMEGHLPAHVDGDGLEGSEELVLVLEPGPEICLTVSGGEGGSLELETRIRVVAEGEAAAWPAPGDAWVVDRQVVVAPGLREARIRIGTRGPVRISARYLNVTYVVEPDEPRFEAPPAHVTFTIRPSCVLDITVLDAESGEPLDREFLYRLMQGDSVAVGGARAVPGGRFETTYRLRPGSYVFQAWADGYLRHDGTRIRLRRAGETARLVIRLRRDETVGSLRVSIPALGRLPTTLRSRAPPAHFLFERSPAQARFDWAPDGDGSPAWGGLRGVKVRESDTDYLFSMVPAGEVSLLVSERVSGRVAYVPGIRIAAGRTETVTIRLEPGFRIPTEHILPRPGEARSFLVRHPVHGALPGYYVSAHLSALWQPGEVPPAAVRIGPYPGPEVDIVIEDAAGERSTRTVRLEED